MSYTLRHRWQEFPSGELRDNDADLTLMTLGNPMGEMESDDAGKSLQVGNSCLETPVLYYLLQYRTTTAAATATATSVKCYRGI